MRKSHGVIIAGITLLIIGIVICGLSVFVMGFDFGRKNAERYEVKRYEVNQSFSEVKIRGNVEDVELILSEDERCCVDCHELEGLTHEVKVDGDALIVEVKDEREWYERFTLWWNSQKVTVILPKAFQGKVSVETNTGDVTIPEGLTVEELYVKISTGDVKLKNVIATGEMRIMTSTGDVFLQKCDADTVYVKTSTGDVSGSFLSDKVFSVKTTTGDVEVPSTDLGGKCEIITSTGDVRFEIK